MYASKPVTLSTRSHCHFSRQKIGRHYGQPTVIIRPFGVFSLLVFGYMRNKTSQNIDLLISDTVIFSLQVQTLVLLLV